MRVLTAEFEKQHIENGKNSQKRHCPPHTDCVSVDSMSLCCWILSLFIKVSHNLCSGQEWPVCNVWDREKNRIWKGHKHVFSPANLCSGRAENFWILLLRIAHFYIGFISFLLQTNSVLPSYQIVLITNNYKNTYIYYVYKYLKWPTYGCISQNVTVITLVATAAVVVFPATKFVTVCRTALMPTMNATAVSIVQLALVQSTAINSYSIALFETFRIFTKRRTFVWSGGKFGCGSIKFTFRLVTDSRRMFACLYKWYKSHTMTVLAAVFCYICCQ